MLTVLLAVPVITDHPDDYTATEGDTAKFYVSAEGSQLSFQWQKNNVNIPLATDTFYIDTNILLADDGALYRCIASNASGSDTSTSAPDGSPAYAAAADATVGTIGIAFNAATNQFIITRPNYKDLTQKLLYVERL